MKAIIPVAGVGTKLRPHTYTQPKALIPLAGKTILSITVDQLSEAGITDFIFIIGYLGEKIQDYVTVNYPHLNCHFVTAGALIIEAQRRYCANSSCFVLSAPPSIPI